MKERWILKYKVDIGLEETDPRYIEFDDLYALLTYLQKNIENDEGKLFGFDSVVEYCDTLDMEVYKRFY